MSVATGSRTFGYDTRSSGAPAAGERNQAADDERKSEQRDDGLDRILVDPLVQDEDADRDSGYGFEHGLAGHGRRQRARLERRLREQEPDHRHSRQHIDVPVVDDREETFVEPADGRLRQRRHDPAEDHPRRGPEQGRPDSRRPVVAGDDERSRKATDDRGSDDPGFGARIGLPAVRRGDEPEDDEPGADRSRPEDLAAADVLLGHAGAER
jgi:hypothetical protein